jgi:hypothetical protein
MMQSQNRSISMPAVTVEMINNSNSLSEQHKKALSSALAQIEANPTVAFYCYEYGQEWWPGKHL